MDENEIGGMEKLPEHTFEVGHSRRRSYLITAETEDEKVDWVETFKVCCRKADGKMCNAEDQNESMYFINACM